ncbi:MAG: hypothetical protein OEY82_10240 [Gammaproteobacteria bacterium]|nr:hypothetical protein [Gammaproteobacteria bacterium]
MTGKNTDDNLEDEELSEELSEDVSDDEVDDEVDDDGDDDVLLLGDDEGFADTIVEASVDALFARIELTDAEEAARKRQARKRLEELRELKMIEMDDTFNFDLDGED